MHRTTLLASALAVLLAGSASFAIAQSMPNSNAPAAANAMSQPSHPAMPMRMGGPQFHRAWGHRGVHQRSDVIGDLRSLEHLYDQSGRSKDMVAVYNDVLARSQDPRVRNYAYHSLARLQARPTNVDQAIATLRKSLDENLANAAKMRSAREQMRSKWMQRQNASPSNAAATSE